MSLSYNDLNPAALHPETADDPLKQTALHFQKMKVLSAVPLTDQSLLQ